MSIWHGEKLTIEINGESHGPSLSIKAEGFPKGAVSEAALLEFTARRAPGTGRLTTARRESDVPVFSGGIREENGRLILDGTAFSAEIANQDVRSADYEENRYVPRPGHADYTAYVKYKQDRITPGGGAFSGRLTAPLCLAGGIALQLLAEKGIRIGSRLISVGTEEDPERFADAIAKAKAEGDSLGGLVEIRAEGVPVGLGGPLFEGLEGRMALLFYAIPGVKGVEFGDGFRLARGKGSACNDGFAAENGRIVTLTNHCGGILGGISDGMPLVVRVAFKPTSSIAKPQRSVDIRTLEETEIRVGGRHDPCIALRALPVTEAAAALALLDAYPEE